MRSTKIVATIGPASDAEPMLEHLIAAGIDVVRLNFSHGTHGSHAATYERVRDAARRAGRDVAVLQDLAGPKIRTGPLEGGQPLDLRTGDTLRIRTGTFAGRSGVISTPFEGLAPGVRVGDRLLLADGMIELRVDSSDGREIATTVIDGGRLGEHQGINVPGVSLPRSAITPKDVDDLAFGLALGVDMVAVSFVQRAADLGRARALLEAHGAGGVPIVAKLERPEALDDLDAILRASDAVMVARGDLGLEMPLERVPRAQRQITAAARRHGVPVIVATQVLESMTTEPRPTRAEVSDAANAVGEGVDAIMLAGETAIGAHPARAVQTLDAIIREAEAGIPPTPVETGHAGNRDHAQALCEAAVTLARRGAAQAIVAVTREGGTARRLSALRPAAPILAATDRPETARRLALLWGVQPLCTTIGESVDEAAPRIVRQLVERGLLRAGAAVVLVSISPDLDRRDANYLKIQRVGDVATSRAAS